MPRTQYSYQANLSQDQTKSQEHEDAENVKEDGNVNARREAHLASFGFADG